VVGGGHHHPLQPLLEGQLVDVVGHVHVALLVLVAAHAARPGPPVVGQVDDGVGAGEERPVALQVRLAQVVEDHVVHDPAAAPLAADVHQAQVVALPERRQQLGGDVPGGPGDQDGLAGGGLTLAHGGALPLTRPHRRRTGRGRRRPP
jgi:hypothetical protein